MANEPGCLWICNFAFPYFPVLNSPLNTLEYIQSRCPTSTRKGHSSKKKAFLSPSELPFFIKHTHTHTRISKLLDKKENHPDWSICGWEDVEMGPWEEERDVFNFLRRTHIHKYRLIKHKNLGIMIYPLKRCFTL